MKCFRDFWFLLLQIAIYGHGVGGDPLMGPFRCPADAKCVETSSCTSGHYITSDGRPYHCGPRDRIDSMICCYDSKATAIPLPNPSSFDEDLSQEAQNISSDIDSRSHADSEDDDVSLILDLPDLPQDGDDEEDVVEDDGIELYKGLHSRDRDALRRQFEAFQATLPYPENIDEIHHSKIPVENDQQRPQSTLHTSQSPEVDDSTLNNNLPSYHQQSYQNLEESHISKYQVNTPRGPRQSNYNYNSCPCEKGERGERGPPGEPGKIIYVPLFLPSPETVIANPISPFQRQSQPLQQQSQPTFQFQPQQQQIYEQDYAYAYPQQQQQDASSQQQQGFIYGQPQQDAFSQQQQGFIFGQPQQDASSQQQQGFIYGQPQQDAFSQQQQGFIFGQPQQDAFSQQQQGFIFGQPQQNAFSQQQQGFIYGQPQQDAFSQQQQEFIYGQPQPDAFSQQQRGFIYGQPQQNAFSQQQQDFSYGQPQQDAYPQQEQDFAYGQPQQDANPQQQQEYLFPQNYQFAHPLPTPQQFNPSIPLPNYISHPSLTGIPFSIPVVPITAGAYIRPSRSATILGHNQPVIRPGQPLQRAR